MIRRKFLIGVPLIAGLNSWSPIAGDAATGVTRNDRKYWLDTLLKIVSPVLNALRADKLKELMPVEVNGDKNDRLTVTHLEAFGRSLAGLAPWLELQDVDSRESAIHQKHIDLTSACIQRAVDPSSPSFMNFTTGRQPLVDAAFFAHALIRAPKSLWGNLDDRSRENTIKALQSTRVIEPYHSNWLLFTAMIEAALLKFTGTFDKERIDYALNEHWNWYKGDGVYGDGPDFHFDYYNSYVIHPMVVDILGVLVREKNEMQNMFDEAMKRAQRYASIQERLISPEGTFPPVGRSLAYRCGAFQLLAQTALMKKLPESLTVGQVRSALTAVIKRTMDADGTFDSKGWLTIGLSGHQPSIGESYISTGSLYLCTTAFLPLGLSSTDPFWTAPPEVWTSVKAFSGKDFTIDKALSK